MSNKPDSLTSWQVDLPLKSIKQSYNNKIATKMNIISSFRITLNDRISKHNRHNVVYIRDEY